MRDSTIESFKKVYKALPGSDDGVIVAAAILVLADLLDGRLEQAGKTLSDFDHQLCLGIRNGLFGNSCTENDIRSLNVAVHEGRGSAIPRALSEIATAIESCRPINTKEHTSD